MLFWSAVNTIVFKRLTILLYTTLDLWRPSSNSTKGYKCSLDLPLWLIRTIRLLFYLHTIRSHKYLEKIQTQVSVQLETPLFLPAEDLEVANCNVPAFKEKKKKRIMVRYFGTTRARLPPFNPTTHLTKYLFSLLLAGHLFSSFHFLSFFFTLTHLISHTLPRALLQTTISSSVFLQDHWKILRNL